MYWWDCNYFPAQELIVVSNKSVQFTHRDAVLSNCERYFMIASMSSAELLIDRLKRKLWPAMSYDLVIACITCDGVIEISMQAEPEETQMPC